MAGPADLDLVRESILTFISDSGDKLVAFVAFVFFANYFSTDAFGSAYTVIGTSAVLASVSKATSSAVSKRVSEDIGRQDRFFSLGLILHGMYVVFVATALWVVVTVFTVPFETFVLAGVVHLGARPVLFLVERTYDGVGSTGAAATLEFADGILTAGLRVLLVVGLGMGVHAILYSAALSALVVGPVAYGRRFGFPSDLPTRSDLRTISSFAGPSLVARIGDAAYANAATVLAGALISPTFASQIKSALTLTQASKLPVRSVNKSVLVQVSANTERDESAVQPVQQGIDVAGLFALPLFAGGLALGDSVMVTVFGAGYGGTTAILVAAIVGIVFETYSFILIPVLNGSDQPGQVARANLLQAGVFVPAYAVAAWLGGVEAFLAAFVVASASRLLVLGVFVDRHAVSVTELSPRFPLEQAGAAAVMGGVVWLARTRVDIASWVDLGLLVGLGGAVYGVVLLAASPRFREVLDSVAGRVRPN